MSGRNIGTVVGAAVGFWIGGPTGAQIGATIGGAVGGLVDPPEGPTVEGPRLNDLKVQTSTYGAPLPWLYGAMRLSGNLMWVKSNKITERRLEEEQDSGKGGGGGGGTIITYEYYGTFAVSLCEGPVGGVRKIWADSVLIYDASEQSTRAGVWANSFNNDKFDIYVGDSSQEPNSEIESDVGSAPAYRGVCYIVFKDLPLEKYGNRIPNITAEVVSAGTTSVEYLGNKGVSVSDQTSSYNYFLRLLDDNGKCAYWSPTSAYPYYNLIEQDINGNEIDRTIDHTAFDTDYARMSDSRYEGEGMYVANPKAGSPGNCKIAYIPKNTSSYNYVANIDGYTSSSWTYAGGGSGSVWFSPDGIVTTWNYTEDVLSRSTMQLISGGSTIGNMTHYTGLSNYVSSGARIIDVSQRFNKVYGLCTDMTVIKFDADDDDTSLFYNSEFIPTGDTTTFTLDQTYTYVEDTSTMWVWKLNPGVTNHLYKIDMGLQIITYVGEMSTPVVNSTFYPFACKNGLAVIANRNNAYYYRVDGLTASTVSLQTVVASLCQKAGLGASDYDVSALSGDVDGFIHADVLPVVGDLRQLGQAFQFDTIQSEYKIKFVPRGGASVVSITEDDLAAHEYGQQRPSALKMTRLLETSLPQRVNVNYVNAARAYDPNEQYAERLITSSDAVRKVQLAIALTDARAAEIADILLYEAWVGREKFDFVLPMKYSYLEPGDIVTITVDSGTYRVRIEEVEFGAPFIVKLKGSTDALEIYTSDAAGATGNQDVATVTFPAVTNLVMLDSALLRTEDDNIGWYYAAYSDTVGTWPGCNIFRSSDSGETQQLWDSATTQAVVCIATTVLGTGDTTIIDKANTLNVSMLTPNGELSSVTETQLLNGSNVALFGASGRWEVLSFQNATDNGDGTYTLDTFIRGQQGTDSYAISNHAKNDLLIVASVTTLYRNSGEAVSLNLERLFYPVTRERSIEQTASQAFTNTAVGLKPLSPVHIEGTRDGSGNLTIDWIRRGRLYNEWNDGTDVPLGEDSEAYEIDIIIGGSPDVVRTIEVSTNTASYTAAQQTTDFGSTQSSVTVKIYQLSATIGRGFAGTATI